MNVDKEEKEKIKKQIAENARKVLEIIQKNEKNKGKDGDER